MPISPERIHALLNPRAVAVVGASENSPWSKGFVTNLGKSDVDVHLVNPRRSEAFGQATLPSLRDLSGPVDHAVVLVGAERVADVVSDAAAAGIPSMTVIASGLSEAGPGGQKLAAEVARLAQEHDIAILGPNCLGFNNYAGMYVSRMNVNIQNEPGRVALTFQSGQLAVATAAASFVRGVRLRYLVSSGNELVVDSNDLLEYFVESDDVAVAGGVLEQIADPERFERIARRAADLGKPIVVLKMGRSAAASRIAVAHTGAVTGADATVDAFLKDLGVVRVDSVEQLAETAGIFASRGWPRGRRAAYVGRSGGSAELFAEQVEDTSLELPEFSESTRSKIAEICGLDPQVVHNPLDLTADGGMSYKKVIDVVASSEEFDLIVSLPPPARTFEGSADPSVAQPREVDAVAMCDATERTGIFTMFLETSDTQSNVADASQPAPTSAYYALGHNGVRSLAKVTEYGARRAARLDAGRDRVATPLPGADALAELDWAGHTMNEADSKALLKAYGIPATSDILATTAQEAVDGAEAIGYPVVLKVVAEGLSHKSDVGGVALNLRDAAAVEAAWEEIHSRVAQHLGPDTIQGVSVSEFLQGGLEMIAGVTVDEQFGPMVVAGLGGVFVEVLKDVVMLRPPFSAHTAEQAVRSLKAAPLLDGHRGGEPLDVSLFAQILVDLGRLALDHRDRISELDVNPILLAPVGQTTKAVDALVVLRHSEPGPGNALVSEDGQ